MLSFAESPPACGKRLRGECVLATAWGSQHLHLVSTKVPGRTQLNLLLRKPKHYGGIRGRFLLQIVIFFVILICNTNGMIYDAAHHLYPR